MVEGLSPSRSVNSSTVQTGLRAVQVTPRIAADASEFRVVLAAELQSVQSVCVVLNPAVRHIFRGLVAPALPPGVRLSVRAEDRFGPVPEVDMLLAVGGGSTMDLAKGLAGPTATPWCGILTKPSAAAFSASISLRPGGLVTSRFGPLPQAVIAPLHVLLDSPPSLLTAELLDTWSYQTAAVDLLLSADGRGDAIDEYRDLFNAATAALEPITTAGPMTAHSVARLVEVQAALCATINESRSTRYVSGVEHMVAHALAAAGSDAMHGSAVGLGILVGRVLQEHPAVRSAVFAGDAGLRTLSQEQLLQLRALTWHTMTPAQRDLVTDLLPKAVLVAHRIRDKPRFSVLDMVDDAVKLQAVQTILTGWTSQTGGISR